MKNFHEFILIPFIWGSISSSSVYCIWYRITIYEILIKARENFQGETNKRFDLTLFRKETIQIVFDALHGIVKAKARDENLLVKQFWTEQIIFIPRAQLNYQRHSKYLHIAYLTEKLTRNPSLKPSFIKILFVSYSSYNMSLVFIIAKIYFK